MPYLQLDPRRAFRAARRLAADPDDLPQVFTIIESLSGDTLPRVGRPWKPAMGLILAIGVREALGGPSGGAAARRTIVDGFRRGLRAAWLPAQEWEALLALPLDEVRRRLSLGAPPVYTEIRSAE